MSTPGKHINLLTDVGPAATKRAKEGTERKTGNARVPVHRTWRVYNPGLALTWLVE